MEVKETGLTWNSNWSIVRCFAWSFYFLLDYRILFVNVYVFVFYIINEVINNPITFLMYLWSKKLDPYTIFETNKIQNYTHSNKVKKKNHTLISLSINPPIKVMVYVRNLFLPIFTKWSTCSKEITDYSEFICLYVSRWSEYLDYKSFNLFEISSPNSFTAFYLIITRLS